MNTYKIYYNVSVCVYIALMQNIKFKSYGLKGHWKVIFNDNMIGYVASPWTDRPYHKMNADGSWSEETYKNRILAAQAIIDDICREFSKIEQVKPKALPLGG